MLNTQTTRTWARCLAASLACLTMAVAGIALAQQDQNQSGQQKEQQQRQREEQQRVREQQQRQHEQQQREQSELSRDAERSAPNRDQEVRPWPSPNREQWSEDAQRGNDGDIAAEHGRSQQGASLGVNLGASDEGVAIVRVRPGSPAERMGVRVRDRVTHINGERIRAIADFISRIRGMDPGNQIELTIVRDQNERTLRGELESLASSEQFSRDAERSGDASWRPDNQFGRDAERSAYGRDNRQTSYEDDASRPRSGDVNQRLNRIEEQIDRLAQAIDDLRATIGDSRQGGRSEARSPSETQAKYEDRQYNRPRSISAYDRWNADENRFRQGDISGARQRSQEAQRQRQDQQRNAAERQRDEQSRQSDRNKGAAAPGNSNRSKNAEEPNTPNDKTNDPR